MRCVALQRQGGPQTRIAAAGSAAKPRTPTPHRPCKPLPVGRRRGARCIAAAAAAQQLEAATALLAAAGVDVAKPAAQPSSTGLVCSRAVNKGEQLFAVPEAAWITPKTAQESEIGSYLAGLEPWLAIALFLLHERAQGSASRWAGYLAALPADSGSPVQWGEDDLKELQGCQLLGTVQGYRSYFQQRFDTLQAEVFAPNSAAFDPAVFTFDAFLWAVCTVRARCHPPLVGANIALVPFADLVQHQRGSSSGGWQLKQSGGLFGAGATPAVTFAAGGPMAAGEVVSMDFGPDKSDGQLLVDHGVLDPLVNQPSYALTLELSPADSNHDDKADVLELNELATASEHVLRADRAPDAQLLATLRLLSLSGPDAFLLESIFRNEVWEHMQLPVSEDNERRCYQQLIDGCTAALGGYATTIDEDLALLASGSLAPGSRRQRAVRVRLGEKEALDATLRFLEDRIGRLENMEYYAERRLKRLGLMDGDGNSTWDGFFDQGIA